MALIFHFNKVETFKCGRVFPGPCSSPFHKFYQLLPVDRHALCFRAVIPLVILTPRFGHFQGQELRKLVGSPEMDDPEPIIDDRLKKCPYITWPGACALAIA